jgi:ATP-dependent helicase/nuclease subunit B
MAIPFLQHIAHEVLDYGLDQLHRTAVVLPAKRSMLYFRKYLAELAPGPFAAPEILILPDWISAFSGKTIGSQDELLLMLYEAYREVVESDPDSFTGFLKWGSPVLSDFSDIDLGLLSDRTIFRDLRNVAEIENWSFNNEQLTVFQQHYLAFWNSLPAIYAKFGELQEAMGVYSYSKAVTHALIRNTNGKHDFTWFVGFSSIRKAEDKMIARLVKEGKAAIRLDSDLYMETASIWHEAGAFMRTRPVSEKIMSDAFRGMEKEVHILRCSSPLAELEAAARIIGSMPAAELDKTGIVLLHDTLLESFLRKLPELPVPVNVALELPVTATNLWPPLASLFKLPQHTTEGHVHREMMDPVFESPLLSGALGSSAHAYSRYCQDKKIVYVHPSHIKELTANGSLGDKAVDLFFPANATSFIHALRTLLEHVSQLRPGSLEAISSAQLYACTERLKQWINRHAWLDDTASAIALLRQFARSATVSFQREPIQGLQVMSMTETRALDLNNWIFIGMSDDLLPGKHSSQSMIPFDLRKFYSLPIPEDAEATFAYTFYRAIAKSTKLHFLYSGQTKGIQTQEPSRYIAQLKKELPVFHAGHVITEHTFGFDNTPLLFSPTAIPNSDAIRQKLVQLAKRGFSPSALNKFIQCPLDFYYRYIAGLSEREEVEEKMDNATFGSIVHSVLEACYTPLVGQTPSQTDIEKMQLRVPDLLEQAIKKHFSEHLIEGGYNALAVIVIHKMIASLLELEKATFSSDVDAQEKRTIKAVEQSLEAQCTVPSSYFPEIRMRGFADRIDQSSGKTLIIDYKTGLVVPKDVTLSKGEWNELFEPKKSKALQLATYCWMLYKNGTPPENIRAGLLSLRALSHGYQWLDVKDFDVLDRNWMQDFEKELVLTIHRMWELDEFRHNPKATMCDFCGH